MDVAHIIVDFNDRDEDGTYAVLLEDAPDVSVGEAVHVFDDEGSSYKARVTEVDSTRGLVRLAVDLSGAGVESATQEAVHT